MNVFRKYLRDNRRSIIGWTIAMSVVSAMYTSFYPTVGQNPDMAKAMDAYPQALKDALHMQDLTDPANYLASTVFGLLIPALVIVMAIAYGVKAVAADEEAHTLDLVLAHPVGRGSLALQRVAAIGASLAIVSAAVLAVTLALRNSAGLSAVAPDRFVAVCVQLLLFGLVYGSLAYAVGAITGRRGLALGVSAGVAVLSYLAYSFFVQVDALQWTKNLSPFQWYLGGEPLKHGLQWGDSGLLLLVSAVLVAAGTARFTRRDVAV
ncbi:ABC transporter permease subunit [Hamadaea tsunoensis]|uniref:ABC transporter permease subunit n=1 Tax=Hamadaea tsunoensis TaxID=53368 RepID=UPI000428D30B|nr:ABC transporter permease subunit [Hamadaea tsunoensis]